MKEKQKINELGGITYSSERRDKESYSDTIENIESIFGLVPEKYLIDFINEYGFGYFNEEVGIVPKELPPVVTKEDPICPIGRFYGFGNSKNSVKKAIETYYDEDQISKKFFPICDSVSGDLIIYSLEKSDYGKIYYWFHEAYNNDNIFLISDNFEEFIEKLIKVKADSPGANNNEVKRTFIAPQMLELMNKTRAKNGLPPLTMDEALNN